MAEKEKSGLDKFRDLYLPTVTEKADKFADTLSYFAGPELTNLAKGIYALRPFQDIPNLEDLTREDKSFLENVSKVAADTGMTMVDFLTLGSGSMGPRATSKVIDDLITKSDVKYASDIKQTPVDVVTGKNFRKDQIIDVKQSAKDIQALKNNYSKSAILNRIETRKAFNENEVVQNFLKEAERLNNLPANPKNPKYNEEFLKQASNIFNTANLNQRLLLNEALAKIGGNSTKGQKILAAYKKAITRVGTDKVDQIKNPEVDIKNLRFDPLRDEAILIGVNNLKKYMNANKDFDPTGALLNVEDLKKVMFPGPENKKYFDAFVGADKSNVSFNRLVANIIKDKNIGFGDEFVEGFDKFGGMAAIKKTQDEYAKALENENFREIVRKTGFNIKDFETGKIYLSSANIVGDNNKKIITSVIEKVRAELNPKNIEGLNEQAIKDVNSTVNHIVHRLFFNGFKSDKNATINNMMQYIENVDTKKLAEILNKKANYKDMFETYKRLDIPGFDPVDVNKFSKSVDLGHLRGLVDDYRLGLDADNLFLQDSALNRAQSNWARKVVRLIDELDGAKNSRVKTKKNNELKSYLKEGEEKGYTAQVRQYSVGDPSRTPFEPLESAIKERISEVMMGDPTYFKKDGGIISMEEMIKRPIYERS